MSTPKQISNILLSDFVAIALGPVVDRIAIPNYIAGYITAVDVDESICHIEWLEGRAYMWRIEDWRTSAKRLEHRRKLSELERATWVKASELKASLARRIMTQTGLDETGVEQIINAIIKSRNTKAASTFDIDLSELIAADEALKAYQQEKKK